MAYFQSLPLLPLFVLTLAIGLAIGALALLAVRASLGAEEMQNLQRGLSHFRLPDTDAERGDDLLQMLESLAEAYPD